MSFAPQTTVISNQEIARSVLKAILHRILALLHWLHTTFVHWFTGCCCLLDSSRVKFALLQAPFYCLTKNQMLRVRFTVCEAGQQAPPTPPVPAIIAYPACTSKHRLPRLYQQASPTPPVPASTAYPRLYQQASPTLPTPPVPASTAYPACTSVQQAPPTPPAWIRIIAVE